MVENTPIVWELRCFRQALKCFTRGCHNQAEYLARLGQGVATIQVCLCKECRHKPLHDIVEDLVRDSDMVVH